MSTITNNSFEGGETLSTTEINNKFQDITNATTANINASNIRDQSIDLAQMESETLHGKSGIQLVTMKSGSLSSDLLTPITYGTARTGTPLVDGGGISTNLVVNGTLDTNDILRVYYSGRCETTPTVTSSNATHQANACWCFWLQWDITDATLTNFTEVPNQGDWNNTIIGGRYAEPTDIVLSSNNGIASTAIVPHFYLTHVGGSETLRRYTRNNVNGTYYYKNTGASVTIYGLRIKVGGIYRGIYEQNAAATVRRNYLEHTTSINYDGGTDTIDLFNMQMTAIIQRTD